MKHKIWISLLIVLPGIASAATEGMKEMPRIAPKATTTVKTKEEGEALLKARGFGEEEARVKMMNLMMVEGSGYEGMDMSMPMDEEEPEHHHGH